MNPEEPEGASPVDVILLSKEGWDIYYESILPHLDCSYAFQYDWSPEKVLARKPRVVVWVFGIPPEISVLVSACKQHGVATLRLQDGVIEWRHCWEYPKQDQQFPPRFRPSLFDKIAVFGPLYRRILESWGNIGKCEIVGCPRWDGFSPAIKASREGRPFRLLIASARNPGFTTAQIDAATEAFADLRDYIATRDDIEAVWRTSSVIQKRLDLAANNPEMDRMTVAEVIASVDAVISTPSTLQIEAMISGRPVASLDYNVTPQYLNLAWTIHCKSDIDPVIEDLLAPSAEKMFFQDWVCRDAVIQDGFAGKRTADVIHGLRQWAEAGRDAQTLPAAILTDSLWPVSLPQKGIVLEDLLPDHPMFARMRAYEEAAIRGARDAVIAAEDSNQDPTGQDGFLARARRGLSRWRHGQ